MLFAFGAPIARTGFYVSYGSAIAAAGAAGTIDYSEVVRRIEGVIAELSLHRYNAPAIPGFRSHLALQRGDRAEATALMEQSMRGWEQRGQNHYADNARLRHAQLARDDERANARTSSAASTRENLVSRPAPT
jgi:hypothetical protein